MHKKLHTFSALNEVVPLSTSVLLGRKRNPRSTAALCSTSSVDSTGRDFGITPVMIFGRKLPLKIWTPLPLNVIRKIRKESPQKLTQLGSRSHPRHLVGKRTAQKDTIIDITSDNQVNSNFPYRWSPASLTFNNYFYLFLYLYIT